LADSNRPTWDQYKKDNEEALNISGTEIKNMIAYRQELDASRAQVRAGGTQKPSPETDLLTTAAPHCIHRTEAPEQRDQPQEARCELGRLR